VGEGADVAPICIGERLVGPGHPAYVIGEISANHGGELDRALKLVDAIADAGADAAKIQTYRAESMTLEIDEATFRVSGGTLWDGTSLFDLYRSAETPWEWTDALAERACADGIDLFSTPFDADAVTFLVDRGVPVLKIASFELVDHQLVAAAARTGLPLVMSTGMATIEEIDEAVRVAGDAGAGGVALLRCNSSYPAPIDEMDLRTIGDMIARWRVPVGLSDHTLTSTAAVASVAFGATIIEKHVTLSRDSPTADAAFSVEPHEFASFVAAVREAEDAVGSVRYGPSPSEASSQAFRRSLIAVRDIPKGQRITSDDVASLRPGHGLAPRHRDRVVGSVAVEGITRGTPLQWSMIDAVPE
jgi:pseudaminic acid synthase